MHASTVSNSMSDNGCMSTHKSIVAALIVQGLKFVISIKFALGYSRSTDYRVRVQLQLAIFCTLVVTVIIILLPIIPILPILPALVDGDYITLFLFSLTNLSLSDVYNALTIHGLATADQLPNSVLDVSNFWKLTCYSIGGSVFSLDDIEHGVLRGGCYELVSQASPSLHRRGWLARLATNVTWP